MKISRHTARQRRQLFELADNGTPAAMLRRMYGVSDSTYYRWRERLVDSSPPPTLAVLNTSAPRMPGC